MKIDIILSVLQAVLIGSWVAIVIFVIVVILMLFPESRDEIKKDWKSK